MELLFDNIDDIEFDNIDGNDAMDFSDAYISSASYLDLDPKIGWRELTDKELDYLNRNHRDWVYEKLLEQLF